MDESIVYMRGSKGYVIGFHCLEEDLIFLNNYCHEDFVVKQTQSNQRLHVIDAIIVRILSTIVNTSLSDSPPK